MQSSAETSDRTWLGPSPPSELKSHLSSQLLSRGARARVSKSTANTHQHNRNGCWCRMSSVWQRCVWQRSVIARRSAAARRGFGYGWVEVDVVAPLNSWCPSRGELWREYFLPVKCKKRVFENCANLFFDFGINFW